MADAVSAVNSTNPYADLAPKKTTPPGAVDKNMFLQLLVAQLRNQDPLKPTGGTEFVGQLAQFQQLETALNMGQDIEAIRARVEQVAVPAAEPQS
jgi:flagellar basal-body rod modification protein FlgD